MRNVTSGRFKSDLAARISEGLAACGPRIDVAEAMGYKDPSTLSRWANGGTVPTAENLASLGACTGLSIDWLVTGRGPMFASSVSDPVRLQAISRIVNGDISDDVLSAIARPRSIETRETLLARMQEIVATLVNDDKDAGEADVASISQSKIARRQGA